MKNDSLSARRRRLLRGLILAPLLAPRLRAFAADGDMHDHEHMHEHMHDHDHHHMAMTDEVKRSEAAYVVPPLTLVRQDGVAVAFPQAIDDGRPVFLNFIYTSCTAICPTSSQVFSTLQGNLAAAHGKAHLLSISIDPEYDTPARLAQYAKQYGAGANWQFFTGTQADSVAMQTAFAAYRGDKMNHAPVTFFRAAPGKSWLRFDGFVAAEELLAEYRTRMHGASGKMA